MPPEAWTLPVTPPSPALPGLGSRVRFAMTLARGHGPKVAALHGSRHSNAAAMKASALASGGHRVTVAPRRRIRDGADRAPTRAAASCPCGVAVAGNAETCSYSARRSALLVASAHLSLHPVHLGGMGDRNHDNPLVALHRLDCQHDSAPAIFHAVLATGIRLPLPEMRKPDYQAGLRLGPTHGVQSVSSAPRWLYSAGPRPLRSSLGTFAGGGSGGDINLPDGYGGASMANQGSVIFNPGGYVWPGGYRKNERV